MKLPKVSYKHLGIQNTYAGQYSDYGAMKGCFGINPEIEVNLDLMGLGFIDIPYTLGHEFFHFLNRPLPRWMERALDTIWDVTVGIHEKEIVYRLYHIFNCECSWDKCIRET